MRKTTTLFLLLIVGTLFSAQAQTSTGSFNYGGILRDYRVYVPAIYNASNPTALVFNYHGYTSDAFQQELYSGMNYVADTAGFIVVYPNGPQNQWNSGFLPPYNGGVDDVGFTSLLIDTMMSQYNIDPARIYACGMSNGGFMSLRLACDLEERIAAVASITGTMSPLQVNNCNASRAMPVLQIHGDADPTVFYNGNPGSYVSVDSTVNLWRGYNGCTATVVYDTLPDTSAEGSIVTTQLYAGCTDNVEVLHYKISNGGHTWPGAINIPALGLTNYDIHGSVEIWRFFLRWTHPNPVLTGLSDSGTETEWPELGPNPFSDILRIAEAREAMEIKVIDMTGRAIGDWNVEAGKELEIKASDWAEGIYNLQIRQGKAVRSFKLLHRQQ